MLTSCKKMVLLCLDRDALTCDAVDAVVWYDNAAGRADLMLSCRKMLLWRFE